MPNRRVTVVPVPNVGKRSASRAVAYLVVADDDENAATEHVQVNAAQFIQRLAAKEYEDAEDEHEKVWAAFDDWLADGHDETKHHGWLTDENFRSGYVFRWDHARQHRRLYGFLVNPRPDLEVCVLCCHLVKEAHKTEPAVKKLVNNERQKPDVKQAIKQAFSKPRKHQGRQRKWQTH